MYDAMLLTNKRLWVIYNRDGTFSSREHGRWQRTSSTNNNTPPVADSAATKTRTIAFADKTFYNRI